ncbi:MULTISPECIES: cytochrome-c peroxidase [unclassified Neorhizobium]|uniref:cytochrome-c peroxidase n=1 Tax=unclassified Neorhizobium TaxID=2629175 RepID=UPI001FF41E06|nr:MULTISPECIES: cytochrome c peroxidase [unclassified Neorhizobium]MCJ9672008.1 c-type cytochrome [Neorhizobium sp. SHOUNA12B]MCJ9747950.1 c-type cytochrome [Neorhizobium sp. SHOUNA12A]
MKPTRRRFRYAVTIFLAVLPVDLSLGFSRNEPVAPLPNTEPQDARKVELGRALFSDTILSSNDAVSCTSCHDLAAGGTNRMSRAIGLADGKVLFNVPTIFNVTNNHTFGWRGNIKSLAAQNEKVLLDYNLMAITWDTLIPKLAGSSYGAQFEAAYGSSPTRETVLDALICFEMSLRTPDAPFDHYMRGDTGALSAEQIEGYLLFKDYGCVSCHQGSNIGGNMTQKLGIFLSDGDALPFRVPSLRNVTATGPYFHDGSVDQLPQAVSIMGRLQLGRELSEKDVTAIVAFLSSLTGVYDDGSLPNPGDGAR